MMVLSFRLNEISEESFKTGTTTTAIEVHILLQNMTDTSPCRTSCLDVAKARELRKNCITQKGLALVVERWQV